jgi:sugar phosphate isomerase/epimerase
MLGDMANNMTPTDWDNVASRLNEAGALVSRNGFRLAYHNHNLEFVKMPDGRTAFDFLVAEMDPALIDLELDVGWVAAAGYDPVAIIRRYGDRIRLVHLRDLAPTPPNNALKANPTDLGQGIVDWAKVLGAINQIQVDHLYVEQEPSIRPSRMQTARVAFNYLKKAFAELSISL